MLGIKQNNIIELLNIFIDCESAHDKIILTQISYLELNSSLILHQLFQDKMLNYYSSLLEAFFSDIKQNILCDHCMDNSIDQLEKSNRCQCLKSHDEREIQLDVGENSFDPEDNSIIKIYHTMIEQLDRIYEKENLFNQWMKKFVEKSQTEISIFCEIKNKYVHLIKLVINHYIEYLLETFKQSFKLDVNSTINQRYLSEMIKLEIYDIYEETVKEYLKSEIVRKVTEFATNGEKQFLHEIINLFKDLFFRWGNINLKPNSNLSKDFESYVKKSYLKIITENFFDLVSNYPESHSLIIDLRMCLDEFKSEQNEFISQIKNQISTRLLTPGIATPLIIEILIRLIRITKILDSTNYLLELISYPIKIYLKQRKDTMRWIITTILSEEDETLKQDLGKQYIKSSQMNFIKSNREKDEFDYLSSDEDEAAAENWQPIPMNNELTIEMASKSKMSDIISSLVNIFGSPEKFIEQYKRMLAERCVCDNNFSLENEIKNLELLKIKFGENFFQGCDIIMKDVKDSLKINNSVKSLMHNMKNNHLQDFELNCLIINRNFWPFKEENLFNLDEISKYRENDFSFFKLLKNKIDNYKKVYSGLKFSRTLNFYSNIGYVELILVFENGSFDFRVTPLAAVIINLFDDKKECEKFTVENISEMLGCNSNDVKKKLNFWVNVGVLSEKSNRVDGMRENNFNNFDENQKVYYEPNLKMKEVYNQVLEEEDIYIFEYVEIQSSFNLENAICSILKNSGPKNFEQLFKNLVLSYQINISEIKLREILGKMNLDQKIFKEGEFYKLIIYTV